MAISSNIPNSIRRPGAFHEFIHTQAGRGLIPLDVRVALIGIKSSAGTATAGTPVQVFDATDGDTKAGKGSELALMVRKAFEQARLSGVQPQIWIVPVTAPSSGSAAAAQTLTVTVTTAVAGNLIVRIAGRTITVGVAAGDAQNTIAAALESAIDAQVDVLPVTAGVSTNVVTCTHVHHGVTGNDVIYEVVSAPSGVSVASTQSVAGAGSIDITASLDALLDQDYDAIAIANHTSTDVTDATAHTTAAWLYSEQKYRHVFMATGASLSTANSLSTAANDKTVVVVSCEQSPSLPGEMATACAVAAFGKEKPNANLDGEELALYPPPATYVYTSAEVESALASGTTPLSPNREKDKLKIERLVTTQISLNGAPFDGLRDLAFSRTAAYMARQIDAQYRLRFTQETMTSELRARVRDMILEVQRAAEAQGILRDVDDFAASVIVEESALTVGRLLVSSPFRVAGPLHQAAFEHVHYL